MHELKLAAKNTKESAAVKMVREETRRFTADEAAVRPPKKGINSIMDLDYGKNHLMLRFGK